MSAAEEEDFPRGGRKVNVSQKRHKNENLFHTEKVHKAKKSRKNKKSLRESVTEEIFHNSINIQGTLSYNNIQEGMIVLGCIRHITNFALEIELPGLIFGFVHVTNISDIFTKYLSNLLEEKDEQGHDVLRDIFKIGQFVAVKILSIVNDDKGTKLKCSLNPRDINFEKPHNSFKKGMLVWGCIQSELDHGYEVNVGVKNCRVFLPSKNIDDGRFLTIGEPLWFVVHKSESTSSVTTLRVGSKIQNIRNTKIEEINNLHDIIPGMQMEIITEKITSSGIKGKFINNYFAYIDQTQLRSPLDQLDTYNEGKLITAFVLYIEPRTKVTYFTLRNLDLVSPPSHAIGDVVSGKVMCKGFKGIYLKISADEKCFVTNRRLIQALPKNANLNIVEAIARKFPVGSKHTCRIFDYNHMARIYICGVDQVLVKEKLFSIKDVQIGELLSVVIDSVKPEGLVVVSGHIRGFVPNVHICNGNYSENLKKKFQPGVEVKARVLFTQDDNVLFTLKSGLVESEKCLTSLEQAKRGEQYTGVVVKTTLAGALVVFYDNIMGWLSRHHLDNEEIDSDFKVDPTEYFYNGQVINPWVLGVKDNKVVLTLRPPVSFRNDVVLKIGQKIRGIVGKVHKDRVDIRSSKGLTLGIVPVNHLSTSLSLCSTFLKTLKKGDALPNLLCIDNRTEPFILSRREGLPYKRQKKTTIESFETLQPGFIVKCSYISSCNLGIYVLPLILDFAENVLIKTTDVIGKGKSLPKFAKYQSIMAKVLSINHDEKEIRLSIKRNVVFDNSVETVVDYFSQHLREIRYLRDFGSKSGWDICHYQPGERVMCTVEQLADEGGCLVTLPNGVKGLIPGHLCPGKLKEGQSLEGVFLSQDFQENYVEVCLRKDLSQKMNTVQDGDISLSSLASCIVENVLVKTDYILGVLRGNDGNKQFVYIPLYLHENDRDGCLSYYRKNKLKICICGKVGTYLIGISRGLFLSLDKQKILINKNKMERKKKASKNLNNDIDMEILPINGCSSESETNKRAAENEKDISEKEQEVYASDSETNMQNVEIENEEDSASICTEDDMTNEDYESDVNTETNGNPDSSSRNQGVKRKREDTNIQKNIKFGDENVKNFGVNDSITGPLPVLPGVSSFFNPRNEADDKTSSDEEEQVESIKKKRKLTSAERAELARQEEERISKIENELADPTRVPENAEQFERLLLANPNSSELWARYITFHIAATELDKARSVAKRALETIDMTLVNEKFNIWIALLNLENLFGTKESFDKTFEESLKYNEPLDIYLNVIKMLSETEKFSDMEEKIKKAHNKFKQEPKMWLEVAKTYYSIKNFREARNIKEAALKSIKDRRTQLNLIIRFGVMEFKYGEEQQGAAIFETILSSDPKKVNVWKIYVDQLIKKDRIEQARKVLERSICQRLPLKNMKTLFLKFREFEELYGSLDSVEAVKRKAAEYVASAVKS